MKLGLGLGLGLSRGQTSSNAAVLYDGVSFDFQNSTAELRIRGISVHDKDGRVITPKTLVTGGDANDFDSITADQGTHTSSLNSGARNPMIFATSDVRSETADGGLKVYYKFAEPSTIAEIYIRRSPLNAYWDDLVITGLIDGVEEEITPTSEPTDSTDTTSLVDATDTYQYVFETKNAVSFGTTGGSYLNGSVAGVCGQLSANIAASYSGSGGTWTNLIDDPIIGNQADAWLGDDGSTNAPTYNAGSGDFTVGTADYFIIKNLLDAQVLGDFHRADTGYFPWFAMICNIADNSSLKRLLGTADTNDTGFGSYLGTSQNPHYLQSDGNTTSNVAGVATVSDAADTLVIMSCDHNNAKMRLSVNSYAMSETNIVGQAPLKTVHSAHQEGRLWALGASNNGAVIDKSGYSAGDKIKHFAWGITEVFMTDAYNKLIVEYFEGVDSADYSP